MNIYQIVAIGGMFSPIIYTATWISSLYAVDAPNQRLYQSLIIINSVLLFVFFLGLHEGINDGGSAIVGPVILLISAAIGILVALFFPLDAGGELITFRGKMHLILVVTMGILQIGGMVALWFRLQSVPGWSAFAIYSLLSAIISFILVIVAGIYATSKYRGLIERIMVSPYQLYYFVLSLMVFLNN
jgi:hypothetical protein